MFTRKIISIALIISLLVCSSTGFAMAKEDSYTPNSQVEKLEEKIRQAGLEYAIENDLLLTEQQMNEIRNSFNTDKQRSVMDKYKKYSISQKDIFKHSPALRKEAEELALKSPEMREIFSLEMDIMSTHPSNPDFGDYFLDTLYNYSEKTVIDTKNAETSSILAQLTINLASIGFKPVAAIAYAILSAVLPDIDIAQTCSDYEVTSKEHTCLTTKWGDVYSSGGLLGEDDWWSYVETQRLDVYSTVLVEAWDGNQFKASLDTAKVEYKYNEYYYNSTYMRNTALARYQDAVDNSTLLYGVGIVWPEYNMTYHTTWVTSDSNPFD